VSKPFQVLANSLDPYAQKAGYGDVLKVEVSQDGGGTGSGIGVFSFKVQKRSANGSWATLPPTFRTSGDGIGMVTLGPGRYRAVIDAKAGFTGAVSNEVTLTEPTVRVSARLGGYGNKLVVDVDPNKGSGYWKLKLQKRTASGAWRQVGKSRRTSGSGEVKTITLPKGTYRVTVAGKYGFVGATSQPVVLPGRTVKVSSGTRGSQLFVRIEPNVGRFTFQLVRNGTTLGTVYRTNASGTALTPPLPPGRYSIAVDGAHGYRGGVFGPITLR
jgi:hypothetical protein